MTAAATLAANGALLATDLPGLPPPRRGKVRDIHPLLWAVAVLFLIYVLRGELETLLF